MKYKIILIYSPKNSEQHLKCIEKVKEILKDKIAYSVCSKELKELNEKKISLALTVGGDGTFIKTASFLKEGLIFGINSEPSESEGALTSLKFNELNLLEKILEESKIIQRQRVMIVRNDFILPEFALNEVYVGAASQFHTSRYKIKFRNEEEEQRSSGVLVVTGSGSNAWYKSAGGKPFGYNEKKLKFLVREPYSGELFKPKILSGEISEKEKIEFESGRRSWGIIALDGNLVYDFNIGDKIEIELSDSPLNVIEGTNNLKDSTKVYN